jgi:hypothetical protein
LMDLTFDTTASADEPAPAEGTGAPTPP